MAVINKISHETTWIPACPAMTKKRGRDFRGPYSFYKFWARAWVMARLRLSANTAKPASLGCKPS